MIKIAITGGIASGKSLVEKIFRERGAATLDTDKVVHGVLENNKEIIADIQKLFEGCDGGIVNDDGHLDRKKIGKIVFSDKDKLKALENIIHPEVKRIVEAFFVENSDKELVVVSVPLLFESGMEKMFDCVVAVNASDELRLQRLINDRGMTEEDALKRMSVQKFGKDKLEKADFVIENDGTTEDLRSEVDRIIEKLRTR